MLTARPMHPSRLRSWMKLLRGKVLVACWSQEDGEIHGRNETEQQRGRDADVCDKHRKLVEADGYDTVDWERFRRMPSARLFVLEKGEVLVMPAGTYHCTPLLHHPTPLPSARPCVPPGACC